MTQQGFPDGSDARERHGRRVPARHAKVAMFREPWPPGVKVALVLPLLVIVFALAWVGGRAWFVKGHLESAEGLVAVVKAQVSDGEYEQIPGTYGQIHEHTSKARTLTDDPLWALAERVPRLGPNLETLRSLTEVVDDTVAAGEPLVALAPEFAPAGLAPKDGKVPLDPFIHAADTLPPFAEQLPTLRAQLAAVPTEGAVPQLVAAKTRLLEVIDKAAAPLDVAVPLVRVLPVLLGANAPRTYVVMFENNAELRSLGGTALSFVEVTVDGGQITLSKAVPAGFENFPNRQWPLIALPPGFEDVYPDALGHFIANATIRPSAVTAAQIIQVEWKAQFGEDIDGVVQMDGPALSALLAAVGPVTLSTGDVVGSTNVIDLLFNQVYERYDSGDTTADNIQQNVIYTETVEKTFAQLKAGAFDPKTLISTMSTAAAANNFKVWLVDPDEQAALAPTPFAATGLVDSTETTDMVGLYLNDQVGSKLNYYLDTAATLSSAVCTADGRQVHRLSLALTNTLDPAAVGGLSPSISGSYYVPLGIPKGVQRFISFAYLPKGSTLISASIDGVPVPATGQIDEDHPVQVMTIDIPPGATGTLSVDFLMGTPGERTLEADITPTLKGTVVTTVPLDCSTVSLP